MFLLLETILVDERGIYGFPKLGTWSLPESTTHPMLHSMFYKV
nr:MAG TPA: hypothetical protein [Caudoviricetes sp.]